MMNYNQFYELNGIDSSDTRIVLDADGNEAKNGSREIPWESPTRKGGLSEAKANALIKRFKINDKATFLKKFSETIGGDGSELKRITTLHSSALLALMCFWRIDDNHPICIHGVEYTKVFFERPNRVIDGRKPSNMDVALISKDKKTVLLLESKFTEFYNGGSIRIADAYRPFYEELVKLWGDTIAMKDANKEVFILNRKSTKRGESEYLGGIKQMVSHLIGILRGPEASPGHKEYQRAFENASRIVLGTILYYPPHTKYGNKYHRYINLYQKRFGNIGPEILSLIRTVLNKREDKTKHIDILPTALCYQDIFSFVNSYLLLGEVVKTYFSKQFVD